MHRPTRKHRHLIVKAERKRARSRTTGNKLKRWQKWIDKFQALSLDQAKGDAAGDSQS